MSYDYDRIEKLRKEVQNMGKEYFVMKEMLNAGFLSITPDEMDTMKQRLVDLEKINTEIYKVSQEIKDIPDVTVIIAEIRKQRIERVRTQRIIRKAEKAKEAEERKKNILRDKTENPKYLGDVAQGLDYSDTNYELLTKYNLPAINNLVALSEISNLSPQKWQWLAYHRQTATIDHYNRFQIPKKKGGVRNISSPKTTLRIAQDWILTNILEKIPVHTSAKAFMKGGSIVENATPHLDNEVVIRIDIKDFFPSVKFPRVRGFFKSLGYSSALSSVFALVCTDALRVGATLDNKKYFVAIGERYLPQGACTSPALTNLICWSLDNRLTKLSEKLGFAYTRYADDMTFSHSDKSAPTKTLLNVTKTIIKDENFELHPDKTLVMHAHQRQTVTGVLVNHETATLSRRDLRKFRAFLHQYATKGEAEMTKILGKNATNYGRGYYSFVKMVNPEVAGKLVEKYGWLKE